MNPILFFFWYAMSVFNADEYLNALEKPTVILNGKTYVGRILSINEYLPFAQRLEASINGKSTDNTLKFAADYLRAVFPVKPVPFWRPDLKRDDPLAELLNHPGLLAILAEFFRLQETAMSGSRLNPTMTHGTDSQNNPSVDMT